MIAPSADTIAAIATPAGRGGIGVIRISGGRAREVAAAVAGALPPPRQAGLRSFRNREGMVVDRGLLLYFPAPHSFTGEDVVELQAHGSPVALAELLETLCACGARIARPGEFSERAFLNGRIDLAQAEAIADLIDAGSRSAARAAANTLQGEFSQRVAGVVKALTAMRMLIEAALDFADEDVPAAAPLQVNVQLVGILEELKAVERAAAQGRRLRDGLSVAIAGRPNVGKSTLLNRLAGVEAAIVSPQAGTTRDVLRENIVVDGLPLTIADTAGLRDSDDPIEQEGVRRAQLEAACAELVLYVVDDCGGVIDEDKAQLQKLAHSGAGVVVVRNKCDLGNQAAGFVSTDADVEVLRVSAATGAGFEALIAVIKRRAGMSEESTQVYSARARHLEALRKAQACIESARQQSADAVLVAEELRMAQDALQAITGKFTSDDLLGCIFASFCLGK